MNFRRSIPACLMVWGVAGAGDVFENDDSRLTASLLSGTEQIRSLHAPDDEDWIFFPRERDLCEGLLTYQTTVRVESLLDPPPAEFQPRLEIYAPDILVDPDLDPQLSSSCSSPPGNAEIVYFAGLEARLFRVSSCSALQSDLDYRFSLEIDVTCTLEGPPPVVTGGRVTAQGAGPVGIALITNFGELTFSEKSDGLFSLLGVPETISVISEEYEADPVVPERDPDFPGSFTADIQVRRIGSVFTDGFESNP